MNLRTSDRIYNSARNLYNSRLHYHNFKHVIDTLNYAEKILKQCDKRKISYDEKVICHAVLFHDAGYYINHVKKGFESKEAYSAFLAENILSEAGEPEKHIKDVVNAVLCTHMNGKCYSTNEMIVRAADLSGLTAPYEKFKKNSIDLYKERELLSGKKITWEKYKDEVFNIIRNFLKSQIKLDIGMFSSANYMFHTRVFQNLDKLMKDTID
jgi:predicted metal-dependent HD superfamily phosphohydrolase